MMELIAWLYKLFCLNTGVIIPFLLFFQPSKMGQEETQQGDAHELTGKLSTIDRSHFWMANFEVSLLLYYKSCHIQKVETLRIYQALSLIFKKPEFPKRHIAFFFYPFQYMSPSKSSRWIEKKKRERKLRSLIWRDPF